MQSEGNTIGGAVAIAAGVAATVAALGILLSDAITTGHWSLDHGLMPLTVGITILSGHLIGTAFRSWRVLSAAGFALLFVVGTSLTVYTSVGRQAKTADTEMLALTAGNEEIARLKSDAESIRQTLQYAVPDAKAECKGAPDPLPVKGWPECKRKSASVEAFTEKLERTEARLQKLGAPKPVAPRADRAAEVLALAGIDKAKAKRAFVLFEPFAFALFFELSAIVAFGFGFSGSRKGTRPRIEITPEPGPALVAKPEVKVGSQERRAAVHSFTAAHVARHGHAPRIVDVQQMHFVRFGHKLPKSSAGRWRSEALAMVEPVQRLRIVG